MAKTFEQWKQEVDRAVQSLAGLSADDLEDWGYRDAYDDGMSPKRAAIHALANSGFPR
jgi:hypothetical protein